MRSGMKPEAIREATSNGDARYRRIVRDGVGVSGRRGRGRGRGGVPRGQMLPSDTSNAGTGYTTSVKPHLGGGSRVLIQNNVDTPLTLPPKEEKKDDGDDNDDNVHEIKSSKARDLNPFMEVLTFQGVGFSISCNKLIKNIAKKDKRRLQGDRIKSSNCYSHSIYTNINQQQRINTMRSYLDSIRFAWIKTITGHTSMLDVIQSGTLNEQSTYLEELLTNLQTEMRSPEHPRPLSYACGLANDCCEPYLRLKERLEHEAKVGTYVADDNDESPTSVKAIEPRNIDAVLGEFLPDFHLAILESVHCMDALTDSQWHHILSKLWPLAGMVRDLYSILIGYMFGAAGQASNSTREIFKEQINKIYQCGLLGNYPGTANNGRAYGKFRGVANAIFQPLTVPGPINVTAGCDVKSNHRDWDKQVRGRLYRTFFDAPQSMLPVLLLREYTIWVIEGSPTVKKHISMDFNYEDFKQKTLSGMNKIRRYLSEHIFVDVGYKEIMDTKFGPEKKLNMDTLPKWQRDFHRIIIGAYRETKDNSYRKVAPSQLEKFREFKGSLPPTILWVKNVTDATNEGSKYYLRDEPDTSERCSITRRKNRIKKRTPPSATTTEAEEKKTTTEGKLPPPPRITMKRAKRDDTSDEVDKDINEHLAATVKQLAAERKHAELEKVKLEADLEEERTMKMELGEDNDSMVVSRAVGATLPDAIPLTRERITMEHDQRIRHYMNRLPLTVMEDVAFYYAMEVIRSCGKSSDSALNHIEILATSSNQGKDTRVAWAHELNDLRMREPYTYNLLQACTTVLYGTGRIEMYDLPSYVMQHQIRAISHRYQIPLPTNHGTELSKFIYKDILCIFWCSVCHTIHSIGQGIRRSNKRAYTQGMQDARYDARTKQFYCKNDRVIGSSACRNQPLLCEVIVGKIFILQGEMHTFCAQPNCGMLFKMDRYTSTFTKYGPQCLPCALIAWASFHRVPQFVIRILQCWIRPSGLLPGDDLKAEMIQPPLPCCICGRSVRIDKCVTVFGKKVVVCHNPKHPVVRKIGNGFFTEHMGHYVREKLIERGLPTFIDENAPEGSPNYLDDSIVASLVIKFYIEAKQRIRESRKDHNNRIHRMNKLKRANRKQTRR
jgi:chaperonin cofactor prefoldin